MEGFKVKKAARLAAAAMALVLFTACQGISKNPAAQSAYQRIQTLLVNLQTYKSEATVEYKSNKGSNTYETLQKCKITGEYRVEVTGPDKVAGNITLSDGKTIYQFNTKIQGKLAVATKESQERSEIFLTSFVKNYLQSQDTSVAAAKVEGDPCTVLEATVPGSHPYLATEKLWVDNQTFKPIKLIIYDPQGSERIIVTYKTFDYNVQLEETEFKA
jgi:outer membrane lipoprotein-sorting protein